MVIEIALTRGKTTTIDDMDGDLTQYKWSASSDRVNIKFYARRDHLRKAILMHRVILERILGRALLGSEEVDHINGDSLDNRRANLRIADRYQNARNATTRTGKLGSKYKGVDWHKRDELWRARISYNNNTIEIDQFESEIDAARAYDRKAIELFGEYAKTNFPREEYEEVTR